MKTLATLAAGAALLLAAGGSQAQEYETWGRFTPTGPNGYVYDATSYWRAPPDAYYGARGPYGYGDYGYGRALPPYGFGSPYYNGYNDPYYGAYGPGVREFLRFGGADFYGW